MADQLGAIPATNDLPCYRGELDICASATGSTHRRATLIKVNVWVACERVSREYNGPRYQLIWRKYSVKPSLAEQQRRVLMKPLTADAECIALSRRILRRDAILRCTIDNPREAIMSFKVRA
jgi:hypothetical protein